MLQTLFCKIRRWGHPKRLPEAPKRLPLPNVCCTGYVINVYLLPQVLLDESAHLAHARHRRPRALHARVFARSLQHVKHEVRERGADVYLEA